MSWNNILHAPPKSLNWVYASPPSSSAGTRFILMPVPSLSSIVIASNTSLLPRRGVLAAAFSLGRRVR